MSKNKYNKMYYLLGYSTFASFFIFNPMQALLDLITTICGGQDKTLDTTHDTPAM